jgi:hypothetical protein
MKKEGIKKGEKRRKREVQTEEHTHNFGNVSVLLCRASNLLRK